jgi:hypothetical protein
MTQNKLCATSTTGIGFSLTINGILCKGVFTACYRYTHEGVDINTLTVGGKKIEICNGGGSRKTYEISIYDFKLKEKQPKNLSFTGPYYDLSNLGNEFKTKLIKVIQEKPELLTDEFKKTFMPIKEELNESPFDSEKYFNEIPKESLINTNTLRTFLSDPKNNLKDLYVDKGDDKYKKALSIYVNQKPDADSYSIRNSYDYICVNANNGELLFSSATGHNVEKMAKLLKLDARSIRSINVVGVFTIDSSMHQIKISNNQFNELISMLKTGFGAYAKSVSDFYKDRHYSGTID